MIIKRTGLQCMLVDSGRRGYQHLGFSQSGALDVDSHRLANILVGNQNIVGQQCKFVSVEVLLGGFCAQFEHTCIVAVTGAQNTVLLNNQSVSLNRPIHVNKGDTLELKSAHNKKGSVIGARNYIALNLPFDMTSNHGTLSRLLANQSAQNNNQSTLTNDEIILKIKTHVQYQNDNEWVDKFTQNEGKLLPIIQSLKTSLAPVKQIMVLPSYQYETFCKASKLSFFNSRYTISEQINRMGIRLNGSKLQYSNTYTSAYSEGIANGAIQVPPNGQPIVLLRDRQTIGGYPKIGTVCAASLSALAQCLPNDSIEFVETDIYSARQAKLLREHRYAMLHKAIHA